ncbi:fasciclin domain-containing protein [Flavobacterium sp. GT2N3]|uniref:fasciclin domain-containing protein n=1 Tax=unclassified Flavobacterium TaxID=196869 RepID=UPI003AB07F85
MKKKINYYLLVLPFLAFLTSCSQDVFDEYYARPEGLEAPIYQQLEARGNFSNLKALIGKAGYKDILSKAGYWTMMAPNDDAFTKFFQEKGISNVTAIDSATAAKIVRYALIYNAFREERLSDYQSSKGWIVDNAFRRRTAFYDGFLSKTINGQPKVIVGSNRNGSINYISGDNNNKYITYFTKEYFTAKGLSSYDFNYFYPSKEYTGFNVLDSKVTEADIIAENGVVHQVDKVHLPLENIDQYLEQNSNYSLFRSLLENNLVTYVFNQTATTTYRNYSGKLDDVFVKVYDPALVFAPNNENYLKIDDNDGQADAYTMIVPENAVLQNFITTILLKNYSSLDKLPRYVFQDLINAHMVQGAVWPSMKGNFINGLNEDLRFDFNSNITDKKVLSNGFFYGSNAVQKSNLFFSVYTSAYLDPKYSFATRIFNDGSGYREMISNINKKFTIFLPSDAILRSLGYEYDANRLYWVYVSPTNGATITGTNARNRLLRLFYNCIVYTPNGELDNIATTSGIIRTGDSDLPGEYIKWSNNKIYAAGNVALGTAVNVTGKEVQQNGVAYYVDNLPQYSEELQGLVIKRLAASNTQFNTFYQYLLKSSIYNATTGKIEGVDLGTSYTFIVPNTAAIARAVTAGVLPSNPATTIQGERDLIADFIHYHIISNKTASSDGLVTGQYETLRKNTRGDKTYVEIISIPGTLSFKDNSGNNAAAKFITASSNNLADRSLVHLVDNYLKFTE